MFLITLLACQSNTDCKDTTDWQEADLSIKVEDLTHEIKQIESKEALASFFVRHPIVRDLFFEFGEKLSDERLYQEIWQLVQSTYFQELLKAGSFTAFESILDKNRNLREFVTFDYLTLYQSKTSKDIFNIFLRRQ